jgi:hypothetical protein
MTIREYIKNNTFGHRAQEHGVLVIYDPDRRYRYIALSMATDKCRVINAAQSVIQKRETATEALRKTGTARGAAPRSVSATMKPVYLYGACGIK